MIKLETFIKALDMLESGEVNGYNALTDALKNICFSELEKIKKQIEEL